MHSINTQRGSGVLVGLLIIIIIGTLGFTGWFVWQSQQITSETLKNTNTSTVPGVTAKPNADDKYILVEEWGVKFTIPDGLGDTTISYEKFSEDDGFAFTTSSLQAIGCILGEYGSDAIWRTTTALGEDAVDMIALNQEKPIGSYYYYVLGSRSSCTANETDSAVENVQREALQEMLKTIQVI